MLRSLFTAALPLSLILTACGGGGGSTGDDDGGVTPEGDHYKSVAKSALVPTSNPQARMYGIDIGAPDGSGPDGTVDNQLGMVLATLSAMNIDVQGSVSDAIAQGSIILLTDMQATALDAATNVGFTVHLGENPVPPACTDANDTVCGKHLTGTGMFSIKANGTDATLGGKIVGGKVTAGPGKVSIQIALGGADPIQLDLIGARIEGTGITATGITTLKVGGALTQDALMTQVLPAIQAQLGPTIARDCTALDMPNATPSCGCMSGSTGATVLQLFDSSPKDCMVTVAEISSNTLIQSLLAPDVKIDGMEALSLGIQVETVGAMF
ncbi:MAG TPA: hypothetical protein VGM90_22565 [Kofleriaceae bacterium]|jgi:hypothetical protein